MIQKQNEKSSKKEKNLNQLIGKLNNLNVSYSQFGFDNKSLEKRKQFDKTRKRKINKKKRRIYQRT